jgi:hypothetical protein
MNKLLEAISASVGEFVNRGFITAGLAPSLLLIISWSIYSKGFAATRTLIENALGSGDDFLKTVGWWLAIVLALAWVLVGLQNLAQFVLSNAPLWGVRDILLNSELKRLDAKRKGLDTWLEHLGALKWQESGERFVVLMGAASAPAYVIADVARDSSAARVLLENGEVHWRRSAREIAAKLHPLWSASKWPTGASAPPEILAELRKWIDLLRQNPALEERLDRATTIAERAVNRAIALSELSPKEGAWVRPTRFGNRLAAIEDYAKRRYGIDTTTLWVRLWGVLSEDERAEFRHAQQGVAAMVNTSLAFFLLAVAIVVTEGRELPSIPWQRARVDLRAVSFFLMATGLSYAIYRAAVAGVGSMKDVMSRWIDLKRTDVIEKLGYDAPRTVAEERALFEELQDFFAQAGARQPTRQLRRKDT